jgi:hypothetical protein
MDMSMGIQLVHAARTCSMDKQLDNQHGHAAWRHGHEAWTGSMDMHNWYAEWTWQMYMHDGKAAWTWKFRMQT